MLFDSASFDPEIITGTVIPMFFLTLSPINLIPLAVRKIRDSRVTKKQLPEIRWAVNYVVSNAASASGDKNAQPDNSNEAGGQKVKGVRELNNENFWHCPSCGRLNSGGFCTDCGKKKPTAQDEETQNVDQGHYGQRTAPAQWKCPACETLNSGDFCIVCGKKRPM